MSRVIKIKKHNLEILSVQLNSPSILLGRSPYCDEILRGPDFAPVHFLLEWLGEGEFDANRGAWSIIDVSERNKKGLTNEVLLETDNLEGAILTKSLNYMGLSFELVTDQLKSASFDNINLTSSLLSSTELKNNEETILEIIELDLLTERVVNIYHYKNCNNVDKKIPFTWSWDKNNHATIKFIKIPKDVLAIKEVATIENNQLLINGNLPYRLIYEDRYWVLRLTKKFVFKTSPIDLIRRIFFNPIVFFMITIPVIVFVLKNVKIKEPSNEIKTEKREVRIYTQTEDIPSPEPVAILKKSEEVSADSSPATDSIKGNLKAPAASSTPAKIVSIKNDSKEIGNGGGGGLLSKLAKFKTGTISASDIQNQKESVSSEANHNFNNKIVNSRTSFINNNLQESKNNQNEGSDDAKKVTTGILTKSTDLTMSQSKGLAGLNKSAGEGIISKLDSASDNKIKNENSGFGLGRGNQIAELPEAIGGLTRAEVAKEINERKREFKTCYESALLVRNDLSGVLRVNFLISSEGDVEEIKLISSDFSSNLLENCIMQVVKKIKFPKGKNNQPTRVVYPFAFRRSS